MKLHLFNIANFKVDGGAMFGVIPKVMWSRAYSADEMNLITLSLRSLVVETGEHKILVDTGWGDKQDEKFFRHINIHGGEGLLEGLKHKGFAPEDITDVFLTHLHADHCGGAVKRVDNGKDFELTFPRAVHHVSMAQLGWAVENNIREEDSYPPENILPLLDSGRLNFIDNEQELFPGFMVRIFYGHTPGLALPLIDYNGSKIFFAGDLIPTTAHIPLIWNMSYDLEPLKTINEKERLLNEAVEDNYTLVFQHDVGVEACSLKMTERGIRVGEIAPFAQ